MIVSAHHEFLMLFLGIVLMLSIYSSTQVEVTLIAIYTRLTTVRFSNWRFTFTHVVVQALGLREHGAGAEQGRSAETERGKAQRLSQN
jgi:hypothetical protein